MRLYCLILFLLFSPYQKLASAQWNATVLNICPITTAEITFQSCSDSNNGAFIVWQQIVNNRGRIFLQHVSDSGYQLLQTNGKLISDTAHSCTIGLESLVSDNQGGFYLGYRQSSSNGQNSYFYISRYNGLGIGVWTGALLVDSGNTLGFLRIVESPSGSIMAYWDSAQIIKANWIDQNGYSSSVSRGFIPWIYSYYLTAKCTKSSKAYFSYPLHDSLFVSCLDSATGLGWATPVLLTSNWSAFDLDITVSANNDVIVAWPDSDIYTFGYKIQRLDEQGNLKWGNTGKYVDSVNFFGQRISLSENGRNGCFAASNVQIQSLDSSGNCLFAPATYFSDCTVGTLTEPLVSLTDSDKALISWLEWSCPDSDGVFVQLYDPSGWPIWSVGGVPIYRQNQLYNPTAFPRSIVTNANGTAICTFSLEYSALCCQIIPTIDILNNVDDINLSNTSVYPNPASDYFHVENKNENITCQLTLLNTFGQIIYETSFTEKIETAVSSFPQGIYFVKIKCDKYSELKKLFVIHR